MIAYDIPPDLQDAVRRELDPGEEVMWSAMPRPKYFTAQTVGMFLFAIPWTAFAVFWVAAASRFEVPQFNRGFDLFPLFGVPFILVGLGMLSSPLWAHRAARRTAYLITDRRAVIIEGGWSSTIRTFTPDQLGGLTRREHSDGTGDVILDRENRGNDQGVREIGFLRIEHAKEAQERLQRLASTSDRGS